MIAFTALQIFYMQIICICNITVVYKNLLSVLEFVSTQKQLINIYTRGIQKILQLDHKKNTSNVNQFCFSTVSALCNALVPLFCQTDFALNIKLARLPRFIVSGKQITGRSDFKTATGHQQQIRALTVWQKSATYALNIAKTMFEK